MRSQGQGLMATLLMFAPLLAVPLVATWGVPWLAANAKSDNLADAEAHGVDREADIGQSHTGRHSVDELFAPVSERPAVDLQFSSDADAFPPHEHAGPNPHLQNASLVQSQEDGWVDPFDQIPSETPSRSQGARQSANTTPQKAAEEGTEQEAGGETPLPRDFDETDESRIDPPAKNPFAEFETEQTPGENGNARVAIKSDAFTDPAPEPRINREEESANVSGTLFGAESTSTSGNSNQGSESPEVAENAPEADSSQPPSTETETQPLTWKSARARLKEFGITHFYLEPDPNHEMYHFRCAYSPGGNQRVNRLFEAEAAEPLEAVQKVLAQVESWTARQSRQQ